MNHRNAEGVPATENQGFIEADSVAVAAALGELRTILDGIKAFVKAPFELPEPAMILDLAPREANPKRLAKYLQQMSVLHAEAFRIANQIKSAYLLDGYLEMAGARNPVGVYALSRSIMEFHAFVHHVSFQLRLIAEDPKKPWQNRGIDFFNLITRARYATSSPEKRALLLKGGVPETTLKPIHINDCLRGLWKDNRFSWAQSYYDALCDVVHHNLSSQQAGTAGLRIGDRVQSAAGGMLLMKNSGPILRYEYPAALRGNEAVNVTCLRVVENIKSAVAAINSIPESGLSRAEVVTLTGTQFGFAELSTAPAKKIGRNAKCPCGSGQKWKKCCGR